MGGTKDGGGHAEGGGGANTAGPGHGAGGEELALRGIGAPGRASGPVPAARPRRCEGLCAAPGAARSVRRSEKPPWPRARSRSGFARGDAGIKRLVVVRGIGPPEPLRALPCENE